MVVGEICNREVVVIHKDESVRAAAVLMREYHVGALVVVHEQDGERTPVGVLTDRDIVVEVIAENVDLDALAVGDVMSYEPITAREQDGVPETIKRMLGKGIRRLPVVNQQGVLVGILAVDDLIELVAEQIADLSRLVAQEQRRERQTRR